MNCEVSPAGQWDLIKKIRIKKSYQAVGSRDWTDVRASERALLGRAATSLFYTFHRAHRAAQRRETPVFAVLSFLLHLRCCGSFSVDSTNSSWGLQSRIARQGFTPVL